MSIKILGGKARGFILSTPKSITTRPTSVLVRRKLFDWRQNLDGLSFVDLCAGSGAMGFEALSRGAQRVFLNDSLRGAYLTIKDNTVAYMKAFEPEKESIHLSQQDAKAWVMKELPFHFQNTENVIIFLDPPYENHKIYFEVMAALKERNFKGELWLESDRLKGPKAEDLTGAFCSIIKKVEQGDHFVVVGKLL